MLRICQGAGRSKPCERLRTPQARRVESIKSLDSLSRAEIAARVDALQTTLEMLFLQSDLDGGPVIECVGRIKVVLCDYRNRLKQLPEDGSPDESLSEKLSTSLAYARRHGRLPSPSAHAVSDPTIAPGRERVPQ